MSYKNMKLIILNKNEEVIQNHFMKLYLRIIKKNTNDIILDENESIITAKYKLYNPIIKTLINIDNQPIVSTTSKLKINSNELYKENLHKTINSNTNKKTKKNKTDLNKVDKTILWDIFDKDKQENELVCVYRNEQPIENTEICNNCNNILIITEDGFPTCSNPQCGKICKDLLDYSPEWRFHSMEDKNGSDPARCGNPINPLLIESSFGCKVICNAGSSYEMKKISKWTGWQSMPHKEKALYDEFQFITNMALNGGIPKKFIEDAMVIHKDISEQKMFRGLNRDGIKSASIYLSCRLNGFPRTAHEIAEIFKLDKASATTGCSMAVNILQNIERHSDNEQSNLCITLPSSFIDRFCSKLNMNKELTMLSTFIAKKIEKTGLITDNIPHAIAAGIIYFISITCGLNNNKQDIKQISGVSEVTINKCYKKLYLNKDKLLPQKIINKYCNNN